MWDLARLERTAVNLLAEGKLSVKPLIGERIPFEQAANAYAMIDQPSCSKIKILLTYSN
jgi:threonine dehydrogenase-like Zn-dependent dehydrogenase